MEIRTAAPGDLDAVAAIEAACFPPAEAAGRESLAGRLAVYPHHFWLLTDGGTVIGFVNGMVTDQPDLQDEMYDQPSLHNEGWRLADDFWSGHPCRPTAAGAAPPSCWNMSSVRPGPRAAGVWF